MKRYWQNNRKIIKFVFLLFVVWQSALMFLSVISPRVLPARERFMYNDREKARNPVFFWNRANFDGAHYLSIVRGGYGLYQQAFFPLYPKIIKFATPFFFGRDLLAALFISNLSFVAAMYLFYKLILLDYPEKMARQTLLFLILFPASFFFGFVYTESLFLALILGSFYAARKKKWLLAGILGALAANTRIIGVFLFPALIYEWWNEYKIQSASWRTKYKIQNIFAIFIVPLGLLSYMKFLSDKFGDALLFAHVQPFFGAERSGGKIILLYQVFWRYLKMILTTQWDPLYFAVWLELLVAVLFLGLLFLAYKKKVRLSYLLFAVFAYFVPTLSGTFLSMSRFALILFPCFISLSMVKNETVRKIIYGVFGILLAISAVFFYQGYWVA